MAVAAPLRNIRVTPTRCDFEVRGATNDFANAVRRSLINDVENPAPLHVRIRRNTTSQTDEYLAHRIGMIMFVREPQAPSGTSATLTVNGRTAFAQDMACRGCRIVHNVPIVKMTRHQELDVDVAFGTGTGSQHAKFSHISVVGFRQTEDAVQMGFEADAAICKLTYLEKGLLSLLKRLDDARFTVETHDALSPSSG